MPAEAGAPTASFQLICGLGSWSSWLKTVSGVGRVIDGFPFITIVPLTIVSPLN